MSARGTALVTVLWILAVISIISFTLAASVRVEVASEMDSFDSEKAFYMARGAAETVFYAQSKKLDIAGEQSPVSLENGEYRFPFDGGEARVRVEGSADRIDINAASDRLLASLFDSLGVDQETRNRLVDSVLDWRDTDDIPHLYGAEVGDYQQREGTAAQTGRLPRNGTFGSVDEVLLVKNMTQELFYGRFIATIDGGFRRIPGVRELIAIDGGETVNINAAGLDVLLALPEMPESTARRIIELRQERLFSNIEDLTRRIPEMAGSETLNYVRLDSGPSNAIVSTATVTASNTSRTVRIAFSHDQRVQIITMAPLLYRRVDEMHFGRWQHQ